ADSTHREPLHIESFPCADGQGLTDYLPADYYDVHVEIWDGAKVLAQSPTEHMDVLGKSPEFAATIYVDAGFIDADWTPCANDGTTVLEVTGADTVADTFISCTAGHVTAGPYRDGTYSVVFSLGADQHALSDVAVTGSDVTHLGAF